VGVLGGRGSTLGEVIYRKGEIVATLKIEGRTVASMELDHWSDIPTSLDGRMGTRGREIWAMSDERISTGVWECDAGRFRASFAGRGELITIVSGAMTCIGDDGVTTELQPGDAMTFPPGWSGEWQIHTPLRKVYCEFKPS
jgi:hypothetical protein